MKSGTTQHFWLGRFTTGTPTGIRSPMARRTWLTAIASSAMALGVANGQDNGFRTHDDDFRVRSTTFKQGAALPVSMADDFLVNGVNVCTVDGSAGGNLSPELSWEDAPRGTRSFAVVLFDETASFTHWGMFNISASTTALPAGAGAAGSVYGSQVNNDFGSQGYEGPCPPPNVVPFAHHYVITVYALDVRLHLPVLTNFPQNAETLIEAIAQAGAEGHVLGKASIGGFFSTTPAP